MRLPFIAAMLLCASALAELPDATIPDSLGVNIHFTDAAPGELEELAGAGFKFVRMDFAWVAIEKEKAQYDFSAYERLLDSLDRNHLRAVLILDYNNTLYNNDLSPNTDESRDAFAKFAAAAVTHFKNRGVLWEMWNEPNIDQFWHPKRSAEDYAKLAVTVGKAIKSAAPREPFIGPACSAFDWPFLETCFKAGCLDYFDAVSVHPYRNDAPETAAADYAKLRDLIAKYSKGKSLPILSGERGFSSHTPGGYTQQQQADYLARQWLTNLSNRVGLSIWYDWHDDGPDPNENEHHFGVVGYESNRGTNPLYAPKPAYFAAKKLIDQLRGFTFSKRIALEHDDDYCLLFTRGKQRKMVVWTRSTHTRMAMIPGIANAIALHSTPTYIDWTPEQDH
jgi:polysaccharide biosynthesis protein PslG